MLVNNAAGNFTSPTERLSHRAVDAVLSIVLHGTFYCTLALGKRWIAAGRGGRMLNIVTTYAETGSALRRAVGRGQGGRAGDDPLAGRRVGQVRHHHERHRARPLPHARRMGAADARSAPGRGAPSNRVPLKRVGRHEELANLAAFLVSDYAGYINGECVVIDGGEWLKGAGQFSGLDVLTPAQWDALSELSKRAGR